MSRYSKRVWSKEQDDIIRGMVDTGSTCTQISKVLHVPRNSIKRRIVFLGMVPKPSTIAVRHEAKCLQCSMTFISAVERNRKFCTRSCAATYNNKKFPKKQPSPFSTTHCKWCMSPFSGTRINSEYKFCGKDCRSAYKNAGIIARCAAGNAGQHTIREYVKLTRPYMCEMCGISTWSNLPLTLELDHMDGNSSNNKPENVRLLCPNCHSQTPTFKNRNYGNGRGSLKKMARREGIEPSLAD